MKSMATEVETAPSLSARVEETVSSQVSSAIEAPCVSSGISVHTITTLPGTAGPSFVREMEETSRILRRSDRSGGISGW